MYIYIIQWNKSIAKVTVKYFLMFYKIIARILLQAFQGEM
jgi:hypothetical protein